MIFRTRKILIWCLETDYKVRLYEFHFPSSLLQAVSKLDVLVAIKFNNIEKQPPQLIFFLLYFFFEVHRIRLCNFSYDTLKKKKKRERQKTVTIDSSTPVHHRGQ